MFGKKKLICNYQYLYYDEGDEAETLHELPFGFPDYLMPVTGDTFFLDGFWQQWNGYYLTVMSRSFVASDVPPSKGGLFDSLCTVILERKRLPPSA